MKDLKEAYKTIEAEHFAPQMEISFIRGDKRGAIQLPQTVIVAGLQANPRPTQDEIDKFVQDTESEYIEEEEDE